MSSALITRIEHEAERERANDIRRLNRRIRQTEIMLNSLRDQRRALLQETEGEALTQFNSHPGTDQLENAIQHVQAARDLTDPSDAPLVDPDSQVEHDERFDSSFALNQY